MMAGKIANQLVDLGGRIQLDWFELTFQPATLLPQPEANHIVGLALRLWRATASELPNY